MDIHTNITSQEEARQFAIEFQEWQSTQNLSYVDCAEWHTVFLELAQRFDLQEEFEENCII